MRDKISSKISGVYLQTHLPGLVDILVGLITYTHIYLCNHYLHMYKLYSRDESTADFLGASFSFRFSIAAAFLYGGLRRTADPDYTDFASSISREVDANIRLIRVSLSYDISYKCVDTRTDILVASSIFRHPQGAFNAFPGER